MREVREATVVVDVHVRQHHRRDVAGVDTVFFQLRADFLFGFDVEANAKLKEGMPGQRFQMRGRAGVDEDDTLGMLDRPGVDRKPIPPIPMK